MAGPIGKSPDCEAGARLEFVVTGSPVTNRTVMETPPSPQRAFFGQPAKCEVAHTSPPVSRSRLRSSISIRTGRRLQCDAVVLCWANASEVWIRAHARQLRDWRELGRTERFAFRGLIAGPPPGNRKKILLRVPPRSEIDKVLDLTEQVPSLPGILNHWFIRGPPNNP